MRALLNIVLSILAFAVAIFVEAIARELYEDFFLGRQSGIRANGQMIVALMISPLIAIWIRDRTVEHRFFAIATGTFSLLGAFYIARPLMIALGDWVVFAVSANLIWALAILLNLPIVFGAIASLFTTITTLRVSEPAINPRHRLLQFWILTSAIWVLFIFTNRWERLTEIFIATEPAAGKGAVTLPPWQYACWATRNATNPFAFMNEAPLPKSLTEAWWQCITYKLQIPIEAFVPPLILLVFGLAFTWAASRFKRS